jgi:hypothetical protein
MDLLSELISSFDPYKVAAFPASGTLQRKLADSALEVQLLTEYSRFSNSLSRDIACNLICNSWPRANSAATILLAEASS